MSALIEFRDVTKIYDDDGTIVLDRLNLSIQKNEFMTLLGPSGCGKTTTLRIIGGFINPTSGDVLYNGGSILKVPPHKRRVNTVFQKYALFPHMDVFNNVAFGLKIKKTDKEQIRTKVLDMLKMVNLTGYESRRVHQLSGGQQQRVAIARALVNEPEILLLDEPLGALDLKLRREMQVELKNMQKRLGITFIYVTHDQEEALTMSDTVVVMNNGVIQQTGTPTDIYNEPSNAFVARFIGDSNILDGVMKKDRTVEFLGKTFECVDGGFGTNEDVQIVIRPEDVDIVPRGSGMLAGVVTDTLFKGVHYEMNIYCNGYSFLVHSTDISEPGSAIDVSIEPEAIHIMKKDKNLQQEMTTDGENA
ncbi:MAG: ABC transporter ATP-binding protein [Defluviitaleaceae bacterium]|nr:ABC transporter ATP-binding protein [Defluviitaleaceae bacterium]